MSESTATLRRAAVALSLRPSRVELQAARLIIDSAKSDRVAVAAHDDRLSSVLAQYSDDCEVVSVGPGFRNAVEFWFGGAAGSRWTVRLVGARS